MPHITVKLYPGRSADQKKQLAREIVKNVAKIAVCEEKSVSVAFEEVEPEDWAESVYLPEINNKKESLVITPGYNPFEKKEGSEHAGGKTEFNIRSYQAADQPAIIDLWHRCNLVVPQNDPRKDIEMKSRVQTELFFVGAIGSRIVATLMAGYDGHRGWIYYLAVDPDYQHRGIGRRMMKRAEATLKKRGCSKINLQVRTSNPAVISFYEHLGYTKDNVVGLGKRI